MTLIARLRSRMVPAIPGYATWYDQEADVYHAVRATAPPTHAILMGCSIPLRARSGLLLRNACALNEFYIAWTNAQTGDLP